MADGELTEGGAWLLIRTLATMPSAERPTGSVVHAGGASIELASDDAWSTDPAPSPEARALLELYLPLALPDRVVVAQLAQSLDGRIATESGHSHYVTGPEDIRRLHRVRALVDAVVVGAETVASDDPRLTVREAEGPNPIRVVLDPDGRLDPDSRVFTDGAAPTLLVRDERAGPSAPPGDGVEILSLPFIPPAGFDPQALLEVLDGRGLRRVLVEGGGVTVSRFLTAGVLDRLHLTVAPLLIGSGRPGLTLEPVQRLEQALRPRCRHFSLGRDLLFDLDLRAPELDRTAEPSPMTAPGRLDTRTNSP